MRHPSILKLTLTSLTSGGRSVGIVRSRTKAMELVSYDVCHSRMISWCLVSLIITEYIETF
jgi:hypothetical protein